MDFLFRTPLLEFDPKDRDAIRRNWKLILNAIENSSPDFALSLRGKELEDLTTHQFRKLLKYLLRGRYRATPFGYWSGVGLGNWSSSYSAIELSAHVIQKGQAFPNEFQQEDTLPHHLVTGIRKEKTHYVFWSYDQSKEGWLANFVSRSHILDLVYDWFQNNSVLTLRDFFSWFSKADTLRISAIWKKLKSAGFLVSNAGDTAEDRSSPISVDLKVDRTLTLPFEIRDQLERIPTEMGALFVPFRTKFMETLKDWFLQEYDDRLVRMDHLLSSRRFWPSELISKSSVEEKKEINGALWEPGHEIDLSRTFEKKEIENLTELQVLFRIASGNRLFVENFTCNNALALMGRFGNDREIAAYFQGSSVPENSPENVYADFLILESKKSQRICSHRNLFDYTIDCMGVKSGEYVIPASDLWMSVVNGKFRLFSEKLQKCVTPVVQHPLNPAFLSHPLCRILWEVAQQEAFRFLPHTDSLFVPGKFCPEIKWGNICLQRPRWNISAGDLKRYGSIQQLQKKWQIPDLISFGNYDRELILNIKDPMDCSIVEQELRSKERCHISTADWIGHSPIRTALGQQAYPQFLKSWKLGTQDRIAHFPMNFQAHEDSGWVYVRIFLFGEFLSPFLEKGVGSMVQRILATNRCVSWYFLYYRTADDEIRLRFKVRGSADGGELKKILFSELEDNGMIVRYRFEKYFPERDKFGNGMAISELLFAMESRFFIESPRRHDLDKAHVIAYLYFRIFWEHLALDWLLDKVKEGQKSCKQNLKAKFKYPIADLFPAKLLAFIADYIHLVKSHPSYEDASSPVFLIHHLHLFVNRMFQNRSQDFEPYVFYAVYRLLKRAKAGIVPRFELRK